MSSVKEVLENSKINLRNTSYLVHDIMKCRGQLPSMPLTATEDELQDILAHVYNRTAYSYSGITVNANAYPANTRFLTNKGLRIGTGTAYEPTGGIIETGSKTGTGNTVGTTGTCRGYSLRINAGKVEYRVPDTTIWLEVPAFKGVSYTPSKIIGNENFFVVLYVNGSTYRIIISPDLYEKSLVATVSSTYYVDEFGRILYLLTSNTDKGVLGLYDDIFNSNTSKYFGLSHSYSGFSKCTAGSFVKTTDNQIWFNDTTNGICYQVFENPASDGTPVFDIPAVVCGSVYCDQQVIEVTGLGFVPDRVYFTFRYEGRTDVYAGAIVMDQVHFPDAPGLTKQIGKGYYNFAGNCGSVRVYNDDIDSTKYGGYISGDSFVLNLGVDYLFSTCDYVAFGKAMGNDPWLS